MKKLTLKHFRELTKDMPDDSIICVPYEHKESSIKCTVNFLLMQNKGIGYNKENYIILGMDLDRFNYENDIDLVVKKLIDKNQWAMVKYQ